MANGFDNKGFKLADDYPPPLHEGLYNVKFTQDVYIGEENKDVKKKEPYNSFSVEKKFCVTTNTEILPDNEVFNVSPAPNRH